MHCKLICQRIFGTVGNRNEGRDLNGKRYVLVTDASSPVEEWSRTRGSTSDCVILIKYDFVA